MASLHELVTGIAAPWVVLSPRSGQLTGAGAEGVYARDRRILSRLEVRLEGAELVPVQTDERGAAVHVYGSVVEGLADRDGHDPTVHLYRVREVDGDGLTESIRLVNRSRVPIETQLTVALGTDLAGTAAVRSGAAGRLDAAEPVRTDDGWRWLGDTLRVTAAFDPVPATLARIPGALAGEVGEGWAVWPLRLEAGGEVTVVLRMSAEFAEPAGFRIQAPRVRPSYEQVVVECDDRRVRRWVRRSLDDLAALQLADGDDRYAGAGPPWYLTLFGRDSLISAAMLIPVDPELAAGTLRALAARQGTRVDPDTAEQPGKIPHELRADATDHGGGLVLPPVYYGTHDATQLWITTLSKAWRWGMPDEEVRQLLPNLERALHWISDYADPDGDGFLEYVDESGHGLANQGWKDSRDAVQWPDGTIATAPIALCEVQGYAYAAATRGAELLDAYGLDGSRWRDWAAALRTRFRERFWVDGHPAIALDGDKRAVRGAASNMGHLLGTGLLDEAEEAAVAQRLSGKDLDSGFGLRTLAAPYPDSDPARAMTRFNPLGYHTGSVWPHDTAMAVEGLYASGHAGVANTYVTGLLRAAESFGYRLPELYGGAGRDQESTPTPYPLSCRPQAWAAAAAVGVLVAGLGLEPEAGWLTARPAERLPWSRLALSGLRLGSERLTVRYEDGSVSVQGGEGGGHREDQIDRGDGVPLDPGAATTET